VLVPLAKVAAVEEAKLAVAGRQAGRRAGGLQLQHKNWKISEIASPAGKRWRSNSCPTVTAPASTATGKVVLTVEEAPGSSRSSSSQNAYAFSTQGCAIVSADAPPSSLLSRVSASPSA